MGIEFLKALFQNEEGKDKSLSFSELEEALSKSDKIKLANLSDGGYVDKGKFDGKVTEIGTLNETIRQLREDAKNFEGVDVTALKEEVKQAKIDAALQIALVKNNAKDVDYLVYKAKNGDLTLDIDEKGTVTGVEELVKLLKTSCPTQFAKAGDRKVEELPLDKGDNQSHETEPASLAEALQLEYEKDN